jgi:uncharacterized protein (TIGR02246 family)
MENACKTVEGFYAAVQARDMAAARTFLDPDLTFYGLFETYRSADAYLSALTGLLSITTGLEVGRIVGEGEDAAIFFNLTTTAPAAGTTLVAEWHTVRRGKIIEVRSAFDGRPFAAMFGANGNRGDAGVTTETREQSEHAIRDLKDMFVNALLSRDAARRASLWTEDGSVVPPQGGFFRGRAAIESHFVTEGASITPTSDASFSEYRFRFITPELAFVDTLLTLRNVRGPDGQVHTAVPIAIAFTAVRQGAGWSIQDERAHFSAPSGS